MRLDTYCNHITDGEHGSVIDDDKGNYYLLSNKNIVNGEIIISDNDRKINKDTFDILNKRINLEIGDVILSTVGTIGKTAVISKPINYIFQRSVGIIKPNISKLNPYYLSYLFKHPTIQKMLINLSNGGVQKGLYIDDVKNLDLPISSINIQNSIVSILKPLDDKIRLNNQIISELESLAKTIYNYWFLQFEFSDENGKPYKSSGGKMVWNKELKHELPEGWNVNSLSAYTLSNYSRIPNNIECIQYLDTANIHKNHIENVVLYHKGIDVIPSRAQRYINKNDILISTVRPNQHHYGIIKHPLKNMVASTGFTQITSNLNSKYNDILYLFITSEMNIRALDKIAASSTSSYPSIRDEDILSLKIALPDDITQLDEMASKLSIIHTKISLLEKENRELVSLRDFLIPLLMNGQAEIVD